MSLRANFATLERIAEGNSDVMIEHWRGASVKGEEIKFGELRSKEFLAVFTTL
jgi:hypothetical protein